MHPAAGAAGATPAAAGLMSFVSAYKDPGLNVLHTTSSGTGPVARSKSCLPSARSVLFNATQPVRKAAVTDAVHLLQRLVPQRL